MPLSEGKSDAVRSANIAELIRSGKPRDQAAAIAYAQQRKAKDAAPRPAAGVMFVTADGNVLLMRRKGSDHAGEWSIPAGRAEGAETPLQTAEREAHEETGRKPNGKMRHVHSTTAGAEFHTFVEPSDQFQATVTDEHDGAGWFPLNALPEPLHPGLRETLGRDMDPNEWESFRASINKWLDEETEEAEHRDASAFDFALDAEWKESEHPRDKGGRFGSGPEGRAKANVRLKEISQATRALAAKGGLTEAEAQEFKRHHAEASGIMYEYAAPLTAEKVKPAAERKSAMPADVVVAAHADLMRNRAVYDRIAEAAAGVHFNAETPVDKVMSGDDPEVTPAAMYDAFSATRAALRQKFGDSMTLYRAVGLQKAKPTTNWATTPEYARQFGANVKKEAVPIDKIIAVNVGPRGTYHEMIVGEPPAKPAQDAACACHKRDPKTGECLSEPVAMDRASARAYDKDGHLVVNRTPVTKANICEYYGREIPDAERLGLDPTRRYKLLRHPDEIKKAAASWNGKPLLISHKPVNAGDHPRDLVVGSVGTNAEWDEPYLFNSLSVWDKDAIDAIEGGRQRELSSAYHYTADMTPGTWEGQAYDGVMRDLHANHVALVRDGRAGSDVVVQDEVPQFHWSFGAFEMSKPAFAFDAFEESKHPRDKGRFAEKAGTKAGAIEWKQSGSKHVGTVGQKTYTIEPHKGISGRHELSMREPGVSTGWGESYKSIEAAKKEAHSHHERSSMPKGASSLTGPQKRFVSYLDNTIIPDTKESGREFTAEDLETASHVIKTGELPKGFKHNDTVGEFIDYLEGTLIPDLEDAGSEGYVDDFKEAVRHMKARAKKPAQDAFEEGKHPRQNDGRFGAGQGKPHGAHAEHHSTKADTHRNLATKHQQEGNKESEAAHREASEAHTKASIAHGHAQKMLEQGIESGRKAAHAASYAAHQKSTRAYEIGHAERAAKKKPIQTSLVPSGKTAQDSAPKYDFSSFALDASWEESKHPRANNGQFGAGEGMSHYAHAEHHLAKAREHSAAVGSNLESPHVDAHKAHVAAAYKHLEVLHKGHAALASSHDREKVDEAHATSKAAHEASEKAKGGQKSQAQIEAELEAENERDRGRTHGLPRKPGDR